MTDIPPLSQLEFWLWLTRRRKRLRIKGPSMLPLLKPGEEVLVDWNAYYHSSQQHSSQQHSFWKKDHRTWPQPADIIVMNDPRQPGFHLIKRIIKVQPPSPPQTSPNYWIEGDNLIESTDSRTFGYVPHGCILGKVTSRFS